jgi:CBS domain containing-hemolysin-like protein
VLHTLGRLPVVGDSIQVDGIGIEVEAVTKNAVSWVLLKRPESQEPSTEHQS